jgi:hypothetical protein
MNTPFRSHIKGFSRTQSSSLSNISFHLSKLAKHAAQDHSIRLVFEMEFFGAEGSRRSESVAQERPPSGEFVHPSQESAALIPSSELREHV